MSETATPTTPTVINEQPPTRKDTYEDDRTGEYFAILYIDEQIVLLRSNKTHRDTEQHVHRLESRGQFDNQEKHGRLIRRPDVDVDIPIPDIEDLSLDPNAAVAAANSNDSTATATTAEPSETPDGTTQLTSFSEDSSTTDESDESGATSTDSGATVDEKETPEETSTSTSDSNTTETEPTEQASDDSRESEANPEQEQDPDTDETDSAVDWTQVDRIGAKAAEKLYAHGYDTHEDIREATDDQLHDVPSLGGGRIENLREWVANQDEEGSQ